MNVTKKIPKPVETFTQMGTYLPQAPNLKCDENSFYPITHETQLIENKERVIILWKISCSMKNTKLTYKEEKG